MQAAIKSLGELGEAEIEYRQKTKSGDYRWLSNHISLTSDFSGKPLYRNGNIRDITDRKLAEIALQKAHDELELRVQERTAELERTNQELLEAKEAAEAAAAAKASFLANMSHELRTPLNSVIGYSSLLMEEDISQDQKSYIEGIRIGGEALLEVLSGILEFSKAEKEKIKLDHRPFSLKHCIDEALDLVAVQADEKGLNLVSTIKHGTPDIITGDHDRLRQILVNLLNNAVKFTDKGDISVSVSSRSFEGTKCEILFEVHDNGIGIPQDKIDKIFESFTQVELTLSRHRGGVGLGLAIAKKLVELMGGTISAESVPNEGTTFRFTILADIIPDQRLGSSEQYKVENLKMLPGEKHLRILIAEDNPLNQRVLVEMLKRMGYRADAVADGKEVILSLKRQDYDLILMDIKMPEMDGITAAKVIRQLKPSTGPKIIAITAFALEGDREMCLEQALMAIWPSL
jgi:signal transduction histidine kinase